MHVQTKRIFFGHISPIGAKYQWIFRCWSLTWLWGLVCQKQVSRVGTCNYIPKILKVAINCPGPFVPQVVIYHPSLGIDVFTNKMRTRFNDDIINVNIVRVTGPLYVEFTANRWIPRTKASDAELSVFFYLSMKKRWSIKQRHRLVKTPPRSSWCHCNAALSLLSTPLVRRLRTLLFHQDQIVLSACGNVLCVLIFWNVRFTNPSCLNSLFELLPSKQKWDK